jgi:hypothetical protein
MDGSVTIEGKRVALKRIVAALIAMAGLGERQSGMPGVSDAAPQIPTADRPLP